MPSRPSPLGAPLRCAALMALNILAGCTSATAREARSSLWLSKLPLPGRINLATHSKQRGAKNCQVNTPPAKAGGIDLQLKRVLPKFQTVIFVHGCFWHRHVGCPKATTPSSNLDFWQKKFDANVARDKTNQTALDSLGWRVIIVWECQIDRASVASLLDIIKTRV